MSTDKRDELLNNIKYAQDGLAYAIRMFDEFDMEPENNVFPDVETAEDMLYDKLCSKAAEACDGRHKFGLPKYDQEFIVGEVHYIASLSVEYNRHDKTYYYVDETEFSVRPKEDA